ncbi:hypothetical protein PROFUN_10178 [Planoprotostelium fungivorum]|uniref:rRNA-processing protein FYV7 n=1 Tax=Planoprotostelium fungivorum TaxID=1890364 RepID=A0A2P6NEN8_9EUKA|nr:hypothetical protein PROFUN_10178 [Planoprotostelium fungivorum]
MSSTDKTNTKPKPKRLVVHAGTGDKEHQQHKERKKKLGKAAYGKFQLTKKREVALKESKKIKGVTRKLQKSYEKIKTREEKEGKKESYYDKIFSRITSSDEPEDRRGQKRKTPKLQEESEDEERDAEEEVDREEEQEDEESQEPMKKRIKRKDSYFAVAEKIWEQKRGEKEAEMEEKKKKMEEENKKREVQANKRKAATKNVLKKTKRGQPVMSGVMKNLLGKIQNG